MLKVLKVLKDKKKSIQSRFKEFFGSSTRNKVLIIFIAAFLLFLILFFDIKLYLYLHYLIGHDVLIKLESDKHDLYLLNGDRENISIDVNIMANPFCKVDCSYKFLDIGSGVITDENLVTIQSLEPLYKNYEIRANKFGQGQDLYRFDIECIGIKTLLCNTKELPVRRSLIISVEYNISENEMLLRDSLRNTMEDFGRNLGLINSSLMGFEKALDEMNKTIIADSLYSDIKNFKNNFSILVDDFYDLGYYWNIQDYSKLKENIEKINISGIHFNSLNSTISRNIHHFNGVVNNISGIKGDLDYIGTNAAFLNKSEEINNLIDDYDELLQDLNERGYLFEKERLLDGFLESNDILLLKEGIRNKTIENNLRVMIEYDSLCSINGICSDYDHEDIENKLSYNLKESCDDIKNLREYYEQLNDSVQTSSYTQATEFWNNISAKVENIKRNITKNYLENIDSNSVNYDLIKQILIELPLSETENYSYNLTNALLYKLVEQEPQECILSNILTKEINDTGFNLISTDTLTNNTLGFLGIDFNNQTSRCCVYGKCGECCRECYRENYPIILLHGHSFNKDLPAEYSLDIFDFIQKRLENDGYIDGGIILYSLDKKDNLGLANISWTFRTSYYFDVFREFNKYTRIQAQNENIDSYAIRLNEIIRDVEYKTNRNKVIIMAHSMGGLIARRYLQIFGTGDVDKIILIGTPNKGIETDISRLCPVFGEKLECRDMNKDSLFMNKLNTGGLPGTDTGIKIYNIIGTGCLMDNERGDGVVLERNAILENANNIFVNGTCSSLNKFHKEMLDVEKNPGVYKVIIEALDKKL